MGGTMKMKQRFGFAGSFNLFVTIMNDSYVGFDTEIPLTFKIEAEDKTREIEPVHKEDVEAVKGPGMVASMLETKKDDESDEEGESSEDNTEALEQKLLKAKIIKEEDVPKKKQTAPETTELLK